MIKFSVPLPIREASPLDALLKKRSGIIAFLLIASVMAMIVYSTFEFINSLQTNQPVSIMIVVSVNLLNIVILQAFLAPGLAAKARRQLEEHSLLREILLTPSGDHEIALFLKKSVLRNLAMPLVLMTLMTFWIWSSMFWVQPGTPSQIPFRYYHLPMILSLTDYYDQMMIQSVPSIILTGIIAGLFIVNFAVGYWLHGGMLAAICQLRPGNRILGGFRTVYIIGMMALLLFFPLIAARWIGNKFDTLQPYTELYAIILFQGIIIVIRSIAAGYVWQKVETGIAEEIRYSLFEAEGTNDKTNRLKGSPSSR